MTTQLEERFIMRAYLSKEHKCDLGVRHRGPSMIIFPVESGSIEG
jgi:hypothetical protein